MLFNHEHKTSQELQMLSSVTINSGLLKREELLWNKNCEGQIRGVVRTVVVQNVSHVKVMVEVTVGEKVSHTYCFVKNVEGGLLHRRDW